VKTDEMRTNNSRLEDQKKTEGGIQCAEGQLDLHARATWHRCSRCHDKAKGGKQAEQASCTVAGQITQPPKALSFCGLVVSNSGLPKTNNTEEDDKRGQAVREAKR
jgi:hypothetical protein